MIEHFSLERVNKAAASFDPEKLWAFQDRHMQRLPLEKKVEMVVPYLQRAGLWCRRPACREQRRQTPHARERAKIEHVVARAGDRIKTAGEILDYNYFFVADDELAYDEKAVAKVLQKPGAVELLSAYREQMAAAESFDAASLEQMAHAFSPRGARRSATSSTRSAQQ